MRGVVQRVTSASVTVEGAVVGSVGKGLCVLVGISTTDTPAMIPWMAKKLLNLRLFEGGGGKNWAKNVVDVDGEILLVSQFTLCHVLKGSKPDFHNAMPGSQSQPFFDELVAALRKAYRPDRIATGSFGAYMDVDIRNDGPVTLVLDAPEPEKPKGDPASPKKGATTKASPGAESPAPTAEASGSNAEEAAAE
ncbi:D-tyrosyl-tRNA(Tyr) deacylase [Diplonema papillatum]|nr:D-tyrosyl-tRNA(Tyr) deacylase [Diplonema papillatum]|eukprot:gene3397-5317_t